MTLTYQIYLVYPFAVNITKRFIKSPKLYFLDVGLIRLLTGSWSLKEGSVFENWVFSELIKWRGIFEDEPELYFYRTASGVEIDFILKKGNHFLPIEVKGSEHVHTVDVRHLRKFLYAYPDTPIALLVYRGDEMYEISKNIWAVPDWMLFSPV
jgi:predicted AAA+ superfamily ATPase